MPNQCPRWQSDVSHSSDARRAGASNLPQPTLHTKPFAPHRAPHDPKATFPILQSHHPNSHKATIPTPTKRANGWRGDKEQSVEIGRDRSRSVEIGRDPSSTRDQSGSRFEPRASESTREQSRAVEIRRDPPRSTEISRVPSSSRPRLSSHVEEHPRSHEPCASRASVMEPAPSAAGRPHHPTRELHHSSLRPA